MAYTERRERGKGTRYRGIYKAADGRYRTAGTFDTAERALEVAEAAEKHAAALIPGATGGLDPVTRATRTIKEYAPIFLRHHQVEGNTKDTYADTLRLHVIPFLGACRLAEADRTVARNYVTALQEAGRSANIIRQTKVVLGAMFTMAVSEGYLDYNPFHDLKIPRVPGRPAIKVTTTEQFLKVRGCLPTGPASATVTAWPPRNGPPARTSPCTDTAAGPRELTRPAPSRELRASSARLARSLYCAERSRRTLRTHFPPTWERAAVMANRAHRVLAIWRMRVRHSPA